MLYFTDQATIADVQEVGGRLVVNARVARGGNVQEYAGREMGMKDRAVVRVYRPADEVFDKASIATFPHKIVTLDHPEGPAQFDRDAVGWIGDEVMRDGEFVRVPMTVAHRKAVDAVKAGKRELSVGYGCDIVFEDGVTPAGEKYDAKMTKIVVDHVAIVDQARGGSQLRIGDWRAPGDSDLAPPTPKGGLNMASENLRKVVLDGLTIETTEQGAQAVEKLQKQLDDATKEFVDASDEHKKALAAKDADLAKLQAQLDDVKGKVLTDAQIDARVQERADLIDKARAVHDADYSGKSPAEIRKIAVAGKLGDAAIKDKAEAYIAARFDILVEDAGEPDPVRTTLRTQDTTRRSANDNGQSGYEKRIGDAWKGTNQQKGAA